MKKFLQMMLLTALLVPLGARAQNSTLTICDGTANHEYVPFYGYYADEDQHNQLIYPADSLTDMVGSAIMQMVFYIDPTASNGSNTAASHLGTWTVSLGITTDTTLDELDLTTPVSQVYEGYFDCSTGTLTLEFESAFLYNGGNLLVDLQHEAADYNRWYFLGVSATGAAYCYDEQFDFLPKVTFTYGAAPSCFRVQSIAASNVETTSMTLSWIDPNNDATTYTLWYTDGGTDTTVITSLSETTYDLTDLTPLTTYYFGVTPDCDATILARTGSAQTLILCENDACFITVNCIDSYGDGWNGNAINVLRGSQVLGTATIASGSSATEQIGVCSGDTLTFTFTLGLYPGEMGGTIVDGGGNTIFTIASMNTYTNGAVLATTNNPCPSCLPPTNLTVVLDEENNATITWTDEAASEWDIVWGLADIDPDTVTENAETVSETTYEIPSLNTGIYKVYVRANCGDEVSRWISANISVGIYILEADITDTLRTCNMVIYDNGGPDGQYTNSQTSTLVLLPNQEDLVLAISGTSYTESSYDYLTIYDGIGTEGDILFQDNTSGVSATVNIPTLRSEAFTIVFHSDISTAYDGFVLNVSCEEAPTCPRPAMFEVDSMTATQAYLRWEDSHGTAWTVEYGPAGFTQGGANSQFADFTTTEGTIDGLNPGTYYDFYLMTICGEDTSWTLSASGLTSCAPMSVPMLQNFEALATGSSSPFHPCWSKGTNYSYTAYPYVTNDPNGTNGKVLYFYASGSNYSYVVLPELSNEIDINSLQLSFDLLRTYSSYYSSTFYVFALDTNVYTPSTPRDTLASFTVTNAMPLNEWSTQVFDFTEYMGTRRRLAIVCNPGSQSGYYYVDNIDLRLAPTCARPDSISLNGATTTSLTLNIGGENGNYLCILTDVYADTVVETVTLNALTHTFNGLTPGTKYTVSVSAVCEDGNTTVPLYATAYTECVPIDTLPYVQDFQSLEASSLADFDPCWSKDGSNDPSLPYVTTNSGSKRLYFYTYYDYDYNYAIMPELAEDIEINTLELSFDAYKYNDESYTGHFVVGLVAGDSYDASTPIDIIAEFNLTNTTPETQYVSFANYTGEKRRIIFVTSVPGTTDVSNYLYLDNVNLHLLPQCVVPTNLAASDITANSATFSWEGDAANYEYVVKNGATTVATAIIDTNEVTINGLVIDNDYTFKVRSVCDEDTSVWSNNVSVHIGYCAPNPTSVDNNGITNVTFGMAPEVVNNNNYPVSSPYYGIYTSTAGGVFAGTTANVDITFETYTYEYGTIIWVDWNNNMQFESNEVVYVGTSGSSSPNTLNASFLVPVTQDTGYYRMRIVAADSYFNSYVTSIAAAASANPCFSASYAVAHDYTLHVMPAPDCMAPAALAVTGLTDNSISISFMGSDDTEYQVSISDATGTLAVDTVEAFAYSFTGLTASTSYTIHVAAICSGTLTDSASLTVSTTVAGVPLPYSTDFETGDDSTWTFANGSQTNKWYIDSAVNHGGSYALYVSNDNGESNAYSNTSTSIAYAYKTFSFNAGQYAINFDWKANGESSYDYLRAFLAPASVSFTAGQLPGGGTSTYNFTTTVPAGWIDLGGKMNLLSTWQTSENIVEMAAAGNYHLVFLWANDNSSGSNPPAAIDNVSIQVITCTAPDSLSITGITTDSATINWHATDVETSWVVSLNGVDTVVNAHPVVFSNLDAGAFYQVSVRAICAADDTSNALHGSFWTVCSSYDVPFVADFATTVLSPCWTDTASIVSSTWAQSVENGYPTTYGYIFSRTGYTNQVGNDWLISPVINIPTNTTDLNLAYMVAGLPYSNSNPNYYAHYEVYVSPTGGSNFADFTDTLIATNIDTNVFQRMYFPMTAYAGQSIRVAFRNNSFYGGAIYLRNIGVRYTNQPLYGVYGNTTAYVGDTVTWNAHRYEGDTATMTLSWTSTMAAAGQGTLLNGTTDSASMVYTTAGIDSMMFVATNAYGADTIRWTVRIVDLNPVSVFPYTTSFETTDADNFSWITRNGENAWTIGNATSNGGAQSLYISNDNGTTNAYTNTAATASYVSRAFNITTPGDYSIRFKWNANGEGNWDYLRAFFVPDSLFSVSANELPDGSTSTSSFASATVTGWTDLGGKLNQSTGWTVQQNTINITTPGRYHLVFLWVNDGSMGTNPPAAIDSVEVNNGSGPINCEIPAITEITATETTATVSFIGEAPNYEAFIVEGEWTDSSEYEIVSIAGITDTLADSVVYTYSFDSLSASTLYTIGVRSVCLAGIYSEWTMGTVTTDEHPCFTPTNLAVDDVTVNSATLSWTPGENESQWMVKLSSTVNNYADSMLVDTNMVEVTGIVANAPIKVVVRAICSETQMSPWSDTLLFNTELCQPVDQPNITNITTNGATVTWNAGSNSNGNYQIEYGLQDFNQGQGTLVTVTGATTYTIAGLLDDVSYDVYVRSICAEGIYSAWSVATFTTQPADPGITYYTVTVNVNDPTMGTVTGGGSYPENSTATLTATANSGYHFVNWNDGNTNATRTITVTADVTYTANFEQDDVYYTVTVETNDATMGTVTGGGSYLEGSTATLTATPNDGYHFVEWNDGVITATRTVTVTADVTYTAYFAEDDTAATYYTVTAVANDPAMGTVTGGGRYEEGTVITLTAVANTGYHFVEWNDGETSMERTVTVTEDMSFTANFEENEVIYYTVTVNYDATMGTVTGIPTEAVAEGTVITLTATANSGYRFVDWSDGVTTATRNITVTGNVTLTANFVQDSTQGIDDVNSANIALYPNPATVMVTLSGLESMSTVTIVDLNGREAGKWTATSETLTIDVSDLAKGAYFVRIAGERTSAIRKLIVR